MIFEIMINLCNTPSLIPNRSVTISEFVRIIVVTLFLWQFNNTKICDNPILTVWSFNSFSYTLKYAMYDVNYFSFNSSEYL